MENASFVEPTRFAQMEWLARPVRMELLSSNIGIQPNAWIARPGINAAALMLSQNVRLGLILMLENLVAVIAMLGTLAKLYIIHLPHF